MRNFARLLNEQKLKEANELQNKRTRAENGRLRYLNTFGFSNFGQGSLKQKRMDASEEEHPRSNIVEERRNRAADGNQELKYLTGFGFSSFGLKRANMIDANPQGLRYLIGFGFSNIGQKRMGQRAGNDKLKQKYSSNFRERRSHSKKKEEETDPRIGYLVGFGFGFGRISQEKKRRDASAESKDELKGGNEALEEKGNLMVKRMDSIVGSDQWGRKKKGGDLGAAGKKKRGIVGIDLWGKKKRGKENLEDDDEEIAQRNMGREGMMEKRAILGLDLWGRRKRIISSRNIKLGKGNRCPDIFL